MRVYQIDAYYPGHGLMSFRATGSFMRVARRRARRMQRRWEYRWGFAP